MSMEQIKESLGELLVKGIQNWVGVNSKDCRYFSVAIKSHMFLRLERSQVWSGK